MINKVNSKQTKIHNKNKKNCHNTKYQLIQNLNKINIKSSSDNNKKIMRKDSFININNNNDPNIKNNNNNTKSSLFHKNRISKNYLTSSGKRGKCNQDVIYDRFIASRVTSNLSETIIQRNIDDTNKTITNLKFMNKKEAKDEKKSLDKYFLDKVKSAYNRSLKFHTPKGPKCKSRINQYLLSPINAINKRLFASEKTHRKVPKEPVKILDAPSLQDDFYLNIIDWSNKNTLAVGLGQSVFLWSPTTCVATELLSLCGETDDIVTSVSWSTDGMQIAVGIQSGTIQIWDTNSMKQIETLSKQHNSRVGILRWNMNKLASGSRDKGIYIRDIRDPKNITSKLRKHKQEVCGIRWSFDNESVLASGGNDNLVCVWDINKKTPVFTYNEHSAAVKAVAWSPHESGLLATGGGTEDHNIKFWNTYLNSDKSISSLDVKSQVCNVAWSKNTNELVSTHGYSLNNICIWEYGPPIRKLATLRGHQNRVLHLACSPDGKSIITGAGDETLRLWDVFPEADKEKHSFKKLHFSNELILR